MEDKELIMELEELAKSLDNLPDLKENQTVENIWNMYTKTSDELLHYKIYNEFSTEDAALLRKDVVDLELAKEAADKSVSSIEASLKEDETIIANAQKSLSELKEALKIPGLSDKKRADIELSIRKCEQIIADLKSKDDELKKQLSEAKEKQKKATDSLDNRREKLKSFYKEKSDKLELDAQTLYFAYDFFSSNPKQEIQSTINDLKDGVVDSKTVNERLQNLKALLNSGLYNLDEINKKARENRKKEIAEAIEVQAKKVREENNIDFYEQQIKYQDEMIKRKNGDLESREALRDEYKRIIKNLLVNGKGADKLRDLYELQSAYEVGDKVNENTVSDALDRLIAKTGGEVLVEKVGRQVPNYFPAVYLQILDKATADAVNERIDGAARPAGASPEELTPIIGAAIDQVEAENPGRDLATIDGPRVEVVGFRDLVASKLESIKTWFTENWKKVTTLGSVAALAVTLIWTSCSGVRKNNDNKEVPVQPSEQIVEQAEKKPVEEKSPVDNKKDQPVVNPGVSHEPEKQPISETDIKLRTEETVQKDHGLVGDSKPADPNMSPHLEGNSVVLEDPTTNTKVYIDSNGNSVVKNNDGTYSREENVVPVESAGDGTVIVHNPQPVMEEAIRKANESQNQNQQPPEGSRSLDDYNKQVDEEIKQIEQQKAEGKIDAKKAEEDIAKKQEEIRMTNDAFDKLFSDLEEEKSKTGGR